LLKLFIKSAGKFKDLFISDYCTEKTTEELPVKWSLQAFLQTKMSFLSLLMKNE